MNSHFYSKSFFALCLSLIIVSCGGGGGDNTPASNTSTINGTAATGAAIVGIVKITGSKGNMVTVTIDSAGNYSANVASLTPPFIISATPTDANKDTQYSYASAANTHANITPLTTFTLFLAFSKGDLAALEQAWATQSGAFSQQDINAFKLIINNNFVGLFSNAGLDPNAFDLFTASFNADSAGFDAILDLITFTSDAANQTFTLAINGQPAFTFNEDINGGGNNNNSFGTLAATGTGTTALGITEFTPDTLSDTSQPAGSITIDTIIWEKDVSGVNHVISISKTSGSEDSLIVSISKITGDVTTTWSNLIVSTDNLIIIPASVEFINLTLTELSVSPTTVNLTGTLTR